MRGLIPQGPTVLSHNDAQENNILSSLEDATKIILIDYEYGMWNPRYYDLGNFLNEWICDNAYPKGTGIAYFLQNWPTEQEIQEVTKCYYKLEQEKAGQSAEWSMELAVCQEAVR